jgi:hypothetical protein
MPNQFLRLKFSHIKTLQPNNQEFKVEIPEFFLSTCSATETNQSNQKSEKNHENPKINI